MATKVKINNKDIVCLPLTFGYMLDIEDGIVEESKFGIIENGTTLTLEEIRELRVPEANILWEAIKKETYPELFNTDGSMKEFSDDTNDFDDKKKV